MCRWKFTVLYLCEIVIDTISAWERTGGALDIGDE